MLHPALPDCPGHEHWARDFKGATGLFSFVLDGGDDAARTRLIDGLELFGIGYSWGGYREPRLARRSGAHRDAGPISKGRWSGSISASRTRTI